VSGLAHVCVVAPLLTTVKSTLDVFAFARVLATTAVDITPPVLGVKAVEGMAFSATGGTLASTSGAFAPAKQPPSVSIGAADSEKARKRPRIKIERNITTPLKTHSIREQLVQPKARKNACKADAAKSNAPALTQLDKTKHAGERMVNAGRQRRIDDENGQRTHR
jgi:hypothetical protein